MTTQCGHTRFTWVVTDDAFALVNPEKNKGVPGHFECLDCRKMIEQPIGDGVCRACYKPIDDHNLVLYSYPQCVRKPA